MLCFFYFLFMVGENAFQTDGSFRLFEGQAISLIIKQDHEIQGKVEPIK